jgi:hypothetical protein
MRAGSRSRADRRDYGIETLDYTPPDTVRVAQSRNGVMRVLESIGPRAFAFAQHGVSVAVPERQALLLRCLCAHCFFAEAVQQPELIRREGGVCRRVPATQ